MIEEPFKPLKVTDMESGTLSGEEVILLIEQLCERQSDEIIYVFTNKNKSCAEYTKFGPTKRAVISPEINLQEIIQEDFKYHTGNYREPTDETYINPKLTYEMKRTNFFLVITQQVED